MKGAPLTQLLLVILLFTALLPGLLAVSSRKPPEPAPIAHHHAGEESRVDTWATLHFAHPPRHVHLHQGSRDLWRADAGEALEWEEEFELGMNDGFAEIIIHVVWPDGTPETVVELTLEPDGLDEQKVSAWGGPRLDTVMAFKWKKP